MRFIAGLIRDIFFNIFIQPLRSCQGGCLKSPQNNCVLVVGFFV